MDKLVYVSSEKPWSEHGVNMEECSDDASRTLHIVDYEMQIFTEMFASDALLIMAQGLGVHRIMLQLIKLYCDPKSLVIVLNTSPDERGWIIRQLRMQGVPEAHLPYEVNSHTSPEKRRDVYMKGGVVFITTRIAVVDLLSDIFPTHLASGILVSRAERVREASLDEFVLRLFRRDSPYGFVKAFSEAPADLCSGMCGIQNFMKRLCLKNLLLWPRFQVSVKDCLARRLQSDEIFVSLTPLMLDIQRDIIESLKITLKELKKRNSDLDVADFCVENSLFRAFDHAVKRQLERTWHTVSQITRDLVADLYNLRLLGLSLMTYDAIKFMQSVHAQFMMSTGRSVSWVFSAAGQSVIDNAEYRVYGSINHSRRHIVGDTVSSLLTNDTDNNALNPPSHSLSIPNNIEHNPKWHVLKILLSEISLKKLGPALILIVVRDEEDAILLREVLSHGADEYLKRRFKRYCIPQSVRITTASSNVGSENIDTAIPTDAGSTSDSTNQNFKRPHEEIVSVGENFEDPVEYVGEEMDGCVDYFGFVESPAVLIHPILATSALYKGLGGVMPPRRVLETHVPTHIIMFDPMLEFTRQVEVYQASRPDLIVHVYYLMYKDSVEEQRYLSDIRRENVAFKSLIREKGNLAIPPTAVDEEENFLRALDEKLGIRAPISTRQSGGEIEISVRRHVLVDLREFRCMLPYRIHTHGMVVHPEHLVVADYVLTPDIGVERKALGDLFESLKSGRLYDQLTALVHAYKIPVLLIEFTEEQTFSLQAPRNIRMLDESISVHSICYKLSLMVLHFPTLRVLWSKSPRRSAEYFRLLKHNQPEPISCDAKAKNISAVNTEQRFSVGPRKFLLTLPGVSTNNVNRLMNNARDIAEIANMRLGRLQELLGEASGKTLFNFMNLTIPSIGDRGSEKETQRRSGRNSKGMINRRGSRRGRIRQ